MGTPILKVSVLVSGAVLLDGEPISTEGLEAKIESLKADRPMVWYYREAARDDPNLVAMEVMKLVVDNRLPISMCSKADFSDYVDLEGVSHPRNPTWDGEARIRWGRIVLAAVAAEVAVTLLILAASTVFKVPGELAGYYVAAPASAVATFLMVLWVARKLEAGFILHGVLVGLVGVVLTGGFIFTAKPEDRLMYGVSFVLRIIGGYLGGLVAQKRKFA